MIFIMRDLLGAGMSEARDKMIPMEALNAPKSQFSQLAQILEDRALACNELIDTYNLSAGGLSAQIAMAFATEYRELAKALREVDE